MHEPTRPDVLSARSVPAPIEAVAAAYRAEALDAHSLTVVYAPTSIDYHQAAEPAPTIHGAPAPVATAAPKVARRRFTRAELCFHAGMAITASGVAAVALSIAAGDATLLLAAPPVAGCATILGSAAAINREESRR